MTDRSKTNDGKEKKESGNDVKMQDLKGRIEERAQSRVT